MITQRQTEYLRAIIEFIDSKGYSPSLEEISKSMGVELGNPVQKMLENLIKKELITRTPRIARSLQVTEKARKLIKSLDNVN